MLETPRITVKYTAYADDIIIYMDTPQEHQFVTEQPSCFETQSGLKLHKSKTRVFFFGNTPVDFVFTLLHQQNKP